MQTRANPTLIGLFVLLSLLLGIGAVFYLGSDMLADRSAKMILFFEGDVRGLQVGSPVTIRGVKVGQVENMSISYDAKDRTFSIPVVISVDQSRLGFKRKRNMQEAKYLIERMITQQGLRARLYSQSLVTGKMEIEMVYAPTTPVRLVNTSSEYPEIPTIPSSIEKISSALEELPLERMIRRITEILDSIDQVLSETDIPSLLAALSQTIHRLDVISADLEKAVPELTSSGQDVVKESLELVKSLQLELAPLAEKWTRLATDSSQLVNHVDRQLTQAFTRWDETLASGESAFHGLQESAESANGLLGEDSPLQTELVKSLRELAAAARSIRIMSEYLERHPEALLRGKN